MLAMSKVNWGPTEALDKDKHFVHKWIEPNSVKNCLQRRAWLITGEKGSGKSAMRRAITEVYGRHYIATPVVDFNGINFKALHENLIQLANTTTLSKTLTLSHYWQYAMLVEVILAAARTRPERYGDLVEEVPPSTVRHPLSGRLLALVQDAWNKIDAFTGEHRTSQTKPQANLVGSSGLSADLISELSRYPLEGNFAKVKQKFFKRLDESGDRVVLILDGFDKLNNEGARGEVIRLIFASLIDAVQSIHADHDLPEGLEIKAFIPHDRYLAITLRDADKIETMHVSIRWNGPELQEFLRKRLELTPKLQSGPFHLLWRQVMPEHVFNSQYRLEEDSFEYVLRHTMMRPRQLQIHLEHLSSDNHDEVVDPSRVPKAIAESSKNLSRFFINEFKNEHPHLDAFISSLSHSDNVLEFGAFRKTIESAISRFHKGEQISVEAKVDALYAMGFFGIVNFVDPGAVIGDTYCPPTRESRRHYVDFFYKSPHPAISSTLRDDSVIALHPIIVDYANLRPHSSLIIG